MTHQKNFIKSALFEFRRYKNLGDNTFTQLNDKELLWKYNETDNSISQIVKHISGNMLSRWTNFLTEDGEKSWRNRDTEFVHPFALKTEMVAAWEKGWDCLFEALATVNTNNFNASIKIRNEEHTIIEAVNRQLAHYANHVGQIVLLGKMIKGSQWVSLSVPKNESQAFNKVKMGK
jgi:hypothetical protein